MLVQMDAFHAHLQPIKTKQVKEAAKTAEPDTTVMKLP
jgi:hypothetical protein